MTIKHKQFNRNILIKSINFEMGCLAGKHIFVNSKNTKIGYSRNLLFISSSLFVPSNHFTRNNLLWQMLKILKVYQSYTSCIKIEWNLNHTLSIKFHIHQ